MATETMKNKNGDVIGYRAKPFYKGKALAGHSKTFTTKKKAETHVSDVLAMVRRGSLIDISASETITLSVALDDYWKDIAQHMAGSVSLKRRINALKRRTSLASLPLAAIKTSTVLNLQNELLETKAPSTVINDLSPLTKCIDHACVKHNMDYLKNPCNGVKPPSTKGNGRTRRLSVSERKVLLKACHESKNAYLLDIVQLAVELGLRQSRLVGLKWCQVDFHNKVVRYESSKSVNKGVPLSAPFTRRMERILLRVYSKTGASEYVFDSSLEAIKTAFKRARNKCSVEDFRFHDLRHEAISRMFAEGLDQVDIMKITGIKSAQTLARYMHPSDEYLVGLRYK